jgi:type IV pilus assembly protein PilA
MQNRKGFTLIELLIVVVIIGILAAIAIPKFANTKEKAYLASMKSDLRNLATAEEAYFADYLQYAGGAGVTQINPLEDPSGNVLFSPSAGVTLEVTAVAGGGGVPAGWSATASHNATSKTCAIFIGTAAVAPAANEGEPGCTK